MSVRGLCGVFLLSLGVAAPAAGQGLPVSPVAPKVQAPPSAEDLQKLVESVRQPPFEAALSRMGATEQQRVLDDLEKVLDNLKKEFGLPVGPVAPSPDTDPKPVTPPVAPDPAPKDELNKVLAEISDALGTAAKQSPGSAPTEGLLLQQLLSKLQKGGLL